MSGPKRSFLAIALVSIGCLSAHADTVSPGEIVKFSFTLSGPPTCPSGPCDTFVMSPFGATSIFVGLPIMHIELFDGNTLLGSYVGVAVVADFVSSTSQFTFGNPTVIDFSSFLDGSINGTVYYQLTDGSITNTSLDPANAGFSVGHATSSNGFTGMVPIVVTDESFVPEPGVAVCVLTGLAAMICAKLRRSNRRRIGTG